MQKYIWDPLGIQNITFHQELKPAVKQNLVKMTTRGNQRIMGIASPIDDKVAWTDEIIYKDPTVDEAGGSGAIGSAVEFIKILNSICANDGKLLTSKMIDEMFTPQLGADSKLALENFAFHAIQPGMFSSHQPGTKLNHGLGGVLILNDKDSGMKSGTLCWSGLPNLLWSIDRESGLSLFYASNLVPFGDYSSHKMNQLFEREMYSRA